MLALTDNAVEAVKSIVSSAEADSEAAGLRLTAENAGEERQFRLTIVPIPAEDDQVIEEQGARVYVGPNAAPLLDDKVLDANVEDDRVAFTIGDQAGAAT